MLLHERKGPFTFQLFISILILLTFNGEVSASDSLPPIPEHSKFIDQIDAEFYPSSRYTDQKILLRWDFFGYKIYPYDFEEKAITSNESDGVFRWETRKKSVEITEGSGKLSLKSEGNGSAKLVLEDLALNFETYIPDSDEPETRQYRPPPMVIVGIGEDGRMKLGNATKELLIKTLFPLPPTPVKIGESVSVPAQFEFYVGGAPLQVKGTSNIKLVDYVEIGGKTCAKIETIIDISNLNTPKEVNVAYQCLVKGKSIFYFNIEDRHFMSGMVAMLMSTRVIYPTLDMPTSQEINPSRKWSLDRDNLLKVEYTGN